LAVTPGTIGRHLATLRVGKPSSGQPCAASRDTYPSLLKAAPITLADPRELPFVSCSATNHNVEQKLRPQRNWRPT
jgi:hypothetical protein